MHVQKQDKTEEGLVSFIVTLVMMLVITLVVIGFTQVANRTQREALDRQLAAQAQYAAESGVNMVADKITAASTQATNNCDTGGTPYDISTSLSLSDNVSVTCVFVNPTPQDIRVAANQSSSVVVPINTASLDSLTFSWMPDNGKEADSAGCSAATVFPTSTVDTCTFALLRVDLVKVPGIISQSSLDSSWHTFYLQPRQGGGVGSASFSTTSPKGTVANARCGDVCAMTIAGLGGGSNYYARISTIYRDTSGVTITGTAGGSPVAFQGAQAIIDSTGKAEDVLKRVQVRYSTGITHGKPPYALQSKSTICKRFTVGPGVFKDDCL